VPEAQFFIIMCAVSKLTESPVLHDKKKI